MQNQEGTTHHDQENLEKIELDTDISDDIQEKQECSISDVTLLYLRDRLHGCSTIKASRSTKKGYCSHRLNLPNHQEANP
jgi:hypothetical protein